MPTGETSTVFATARTTTDLGIDTSATAKATVDLGVDTTVSASAATITTAMDDDQATHVTDSSAAAAATTTHIDVGTTTGEKETEIATGIPTTHAGKDATATPTRMEPPTATPASHTTASRSTAVAATATSKSNKPEGSASGGVFANATAISTTAITDAAATSTAVDAFNGSTTARTNFTTIHDPTASAEEPTASNANPPSSTTDSVNHSAGPFAPRSTMGAADISPTTAASTNSTPNVVAHPRTGTSPPITTAAAAGGRSTRSRAGSGGSEVVGAAARLSNTSSWGGTDTNASVTQTGTRTWLGSGGAPDTNNIPQDSATLAATVANYTLHDNSSTLASTASRLNHTPHLNTPSDTGSAVDTAGSGGGVDGAQTYIIVAGAVLLVILFLGFALGWRLRVTDGVERYEERYATPPNDDHMQVPLLICTVCVWRGGGGTG